LVAEEKRRGNQKQGGGRYRAGRDTFTYIHTIVQEYAHVRVLYLDNASWTRTRIASLGVLKQRSKGITV